MPKITKDKVVYCSHIVINRIEDEQGSQWIVDVFTASDERLVRVCRSREPSEITRFFACNFGYPKQTTC